MNNRDNSVSIFHDFTDILEASGLGTWILVDVMSGEYHFTDIYGVNLTTHFFNL